MIWTMLILLTQTSTLLIRKLARLPDCDGQAADAVSTYTQVKMEDAHRLLRIPTKSECPYTWIRLPRHEWPKSWANIGDPVILRARNLYGHPLAGLLWEGQFEEGLLELGWVKKGRIGNVCSLIANKGYFLSVSVDDIKMAGKNQNTDPCGTN